MARIEKEDGTVVCERCVDAHSPFARMKGLLGHRSLPSDEGILLRPAGSVHTAFMRFPIDVVFLDREVTVLRVATLPPWRAAGAKRSKAVLELAAGEAERRGLREGDRLRVLD